MAAGGHRSLYDLAGRHGPVIVRAALAAIVVMLGACNSPAPQGPDRSALRPISLPDLTHASGPVQSQLRGQYASLTEKIQNPKVPAADLAMAFGEMGKLLMAAEYREAAETCFLNAAALAPDAARWPYYLAHLYKIRGEAIKSIASFERARTIQPTDVNTLIWLGEAYLDRGEPETAEPLFANVLSQQPQSVAALFGLGRAALARSEYARAVRHLERALSLDPQTIAIHYPLALAYRGMGETEKADAHMRRRGPGEIRHPDPLMLELDSLLESAVAYEVRGARALDDRDWKRAAAAFRRGIELAPNEPSLHHKLGTALFLDGDAAGAVAEFEAALRLSPHFAKAHYSLGIMHGSSGRPAQAIEHLSAAVRDDPAYVEARLRLADVLRMSGRAAASLPHYERAAALDPRLADAPFGYALALVDLGRHRDARDRFAEGTRRYPDHSGFAHALVRLLAAAPDEGVRDGRAALSLMETLLANGPRTYQIAEMMAMALAEVGRFADAASWQRDAIADAERARRPDAAKRLAETLAKYERRQPCRTPWHRDDPPGSLSGP
jgi:tetratricopeptide (TPR) repeat protein